MSKLIYRHIATGSMVDASETQSDAVIFIRPRIYQMLQHAMVSQQYNLNKIPYSDDWCLEDWDYTERLSFRELQEINNWLYVRPEHNALRIKCKRLLDIEYSRVKQNEDYEKMVMGDWND